MLLRGHGTYVQDDKVISSVTGRVERVNKLVSVRPLRSRFVPEVGDLVVGRITEVSGLILLSRESLKEVCKPQKREENGRTS